MRNPLEAVGQAWNSVFKRNRALSEKNWNEYCIACAEFFKAMEYLRKNESDVKYNITKFIWLPEYVELKKEIL